MAWFNRPEGFVTKSFDGAAPKTEVANEIRATTQVPHIHNYHRGADNWLDCADPDHWVTQDGCVLTTCPQWQ